MVQFSYSARHSPKEQSMPSGSAQLKLSPDELIEAVERLDPQDAERVTQRLLHITASRRASSLTERESQLLREVYLPKRPGFQERFDELNKKRRSFSLTEDEHKELLQL